MKRQEKKKTVKKSGSEQDAPDPQNMEFHRDALALIPSPGDRRPGIAFLTKNGALFHCSCSCSSSKHDSRICRHISTLEKLYETAVNNLGGITPDEDFREGVWHRIASILGEESRTETQSVVIGKTEKNGHSFINVSDGKGGELLHYLSKKGDLTRFLGRMQTQSLKNRVPTRGVIIEKLVEMSMNDTERELRQKGMKTRRQAMEASFWHRLSYHAYREFGNSGFVMRPSIAGSSGDFTLACARQNGDVAFRIIVPRKLVKKLVGGIVKIMPEMPGLTIHPIPLRTVLKVAAGTDSNLEVRPMIRFVHENGKKEHYEKDSLEKFRYGNLYYIKDHKIMAELYKADKDYDLASSGPGVIEKENVPSFLDKHGEDLRTGDHLVDAEISGLGIFKCADRIGISPAALQRDWCWLSVKYEFGNSTVSLAEIVRARNEERRYIGCDDGWIDTEAPELKVVGDLMGLSRSPETSDPQNTVKLNYLEFLRINALAGKRLSLDKDADGADRLARLMELRPARSIRKIKGLKSSLRKYQKVGVEWLRFLFENGFGGLLCDDMGLGKTHQVMALMLVLREREKIKKPFIVVCPTTVMSHWKSKISAHAPGLDAAIYHGSFRSLDETMENASVILTSYGILWRDIEQLKSISFALAVFDEVQQIKNSATNGHRAACELDADMKLGLTGTPIENGLKELKAIFDLSVPGYLGTDAGFERRYVQPVRENDETSKKEELSRLISPFTLRRLKRTVLDELPEKIEDVRTCLLSDDQIGLYREAVDSRGKRLSDAIANGREPIPYMHIFALLNMLKQICDHPVLVEGETGDYEKYESGKWDLFKELLDESLGSGQKVVVFSQYLGMIDIIGRHLKTLNTDFAVLTGASKNRGELIDRFNNDPDCRVFVGSLKAGGTGIDLVAASVVIHYDRWWNAAKEDQATDRVHRIGQKRGVQVFKLVTEGTLEEKISAIIDKKRDLMESIVKEDDPGLLKAFSREELIDLIAYGND